MFPIIEEYLKSINKGKAIKVRLRCEEKMTRGSLVLDYFQGGKREKLSLKLYVNDDIAKPYNSDVIRKAILARDQKEIELEQHRGVFTLSREKKLVTEDVYTAMRNWYKENYSPLSSQASHMLAANCFEKFMKRKNIKIYDVTKDHIRSFRKWLLETKTRNYARHLLGRIAVYFNKMEDEGVIDQSPARRITISEEAKTGIVYLNQAELDQIANVTHDEVVAWAKSADPKLFKDKKAQGYLRNLDRAEFDEIRTTFIFQCFTGLRISDARKLTPESFTAPGVVSILMQKTRRPLTIPLHETAQQIARKRMESLGPKTPLFQSARSTDYSRVMFAIGKTLGIDKKLESRIARRSFASLLVQNQVAIYDASKMLGHASVKMTEKHYAALSTDGLRKELAKVPGIDLENSAIAV